MRSGKRAHKHREMQLIYMYECMCVLTLKICLIYACIDIFTNRQIYINRSKGLQNNSELAFSAFCALLPTDCLVLCELSCQLGVLTLLVIIFI